MSSSSEASSILIRARRLLTAGDEAGAAAAFEELLRVDPAHGGALSFLSMRAFRAGDHAASLGYINRAIAAMPGQAPLLRNRAAIFAAQGNLDAAESDLRDAVAVEPRNCLNLLQLGALRERKGDLTGANSSYNAALRVEPRLGRAETAAELPPPVPELAWQRHAAMLRWIGERFDKVLAEVGAKRPGESLARLERAARMHRGEEPMKQGHPLQRPHELYIPDLPPVPWIERHEAAWAAGLEARVAEIRAEYENVSASSEGFEPYIGKAPDPTEGWKKLEGRDTWNSFFLYRQATRVEANCARCPATLAALEAVPLTLSLGAPTEVFFSVLAPGGHIPPHFGLTNAKCVVHLPLVVPPDCEIRVGPETRTWSEGECLIFDDSFEHEAVNRSDRPRAVLIFEVWNPRLTPAEVEAAAGMLDVLGDFKHL
jgi:aspartate beta-hydroxylase